MTRAQINLILVTVTLVIITFDSFHLLNFLTSPLEKIIIPLKGQLYNSSLFVKNFRNIFVQYPNLSSLLDDKNKLQIENSELLSRLKVITEENEKLRLQLGAPLPSAYQFIPAKILALNRYLEIDTGSKNGIQKGMSVVIGANYVGRINSFSENRSLVLLPTDADSIIASKTDRGTKGQIIGQGNNIIFDKILQKDPLFINDLILTSGENNFPPDLVIGKINHIISSDVDVYKRAKIEPIVDIKSEKYVYVISSL